MRERLGKVRIIHRLRKTTENTEIYKEHRNFFFAPLGEAMPRPYSALCSASLR